MFNQCEKCGMFRLREQYDSCQWCISATKNKPIDVPKNGISIDDRRKNKRDNHTALVCGNKCPKHLIKNQKV